MDCRQIEDLLTPYALDVLGPQDTQLVDLHLETCPWCPIQVRELREVAAALAQSVEQRPPPDHVLRAVLAAAQPPRRSRSQPRGPLSVFTAFAYASVTIVILLLGGILAFSVRTSDKVGDLEATNRTLTQDMAGLQQDNENLTQQLVLLRDGNSQVAEKVSEMTNSNLVLLSQRNQDLSQSQYLVERMDNLTTKDEEFLQVLNMERAIIYMLTLPSTRVLNLQAYADTTAQGSLMFNSGTSRGVFIASGLQPSSVGEEYQIWLGKKGQSPSSLGRLVTDEMGWGIASVWSSESMEHYDWVRLSMEETSSDSTENIMWGVLKEAGPVRP